MKCTGEVGDKSGNLGNVSDERTLALICAVMAGCSAGFNDYAAYASVLSCA